MDTTHDHARAVRVTRKCFLCGAQGALLAAAAIAARPELALADSHSQEVDIGRQFYADQRKQGLVLDQSPYYAVVRAIGRRISDAAQPHWWPMTWVIVKGKQANT